MIPRLSRSGTALEQRMVQAAREERPPAGAEARALASLGLASGGQGPAGSGGQPFSASPRSSGPACASAAPGAFAASKGAGICLALVLGGALASTWARPPALGSTETAPVIGASEDEGTPARVAYPYAGSTAPAEGSVDGARDARTGRSPLPAAAQPGGPRPLARAAPSTERAASGGGGAAKTPGRPSSGAPAPSLSAEVALVQQAARALARGEADRALGVLALHRSQYPNGVLAGEADVLRVQALFATGDPAQATRIARALLAADPRGVLGPRLHALLGEGAP